MPGIDLDDPVLDAQLLPSDASHGDKNVAALTTGQVHTWVGQSLPIID